MKPEQQYAGVNSQDQEDAHDDSATEAGMSLLSEEDGIWKGEEHKSQTRSKHGRIKQWSSLLFSTQGILNTILLLVILGLLVERRWHQERIGLFEAAGDLTGFAPRCKSLNHLSIVPYAETSSKSLTTDHHVCARSHVRSRERVRFLYPRGSREVAVFSAK